MNHTKKNVSLERKCSHINHSERQLSCLVSAGYKKWRSTKLYPSIPQKCILTVQRSTIIISSFVCIHYNNSLVCDYRHLNFTSTICHNDKMWSPHLLFFLTNDCVRYRTIHIFTLNSTFVHMHGNFSTVNYARYLISYKDMFIQNFLGSSHKSLPLLMSF